MATAVLSVTLFGEESSSRSLIPLVRIGPLVQPVQGGGIAPTVLDLPSRGGMGVEKSTPVLPTENHIIKMEIV